MAASHSERPDELVPSLGGFLVARSSSDTRPTAEALTTHLKLLSTFHTLRYRIENEDGLFNVHDLLVPSQRDIEADSSLIPRREEGLAKIREKRWAIYVARAVGRFESWWRNMIPCSIRGVQMERLETVHMKSKTVFESLIKTARSLVFTVDNLPPLDVLMVWHAYMLSPRDFLEDCIRFGKMDFWATGIPWEVVNSCIDTNFNFVPSQNAMEDFEQQVGQSWDNLQGPLAKVIPCPQDKSPINCPWTTIYTLSEYFTRKDRQQNIEATLSGQGFAEEDFRAICSTCNTVITHDYLRVQRFRMEAQDMIVHGYPMSGTVLSILNGTPTAPAGVLNELTKTDTTEEIIHLIDFRIAEKDGLTSMGDIKDSIQDAISGKTIMGRSSPALSTMTDEVQLVLRRIMSRYWDNHSIFAHDLVGAVIRQGSFIKQMNEIHWLGTPTREYTLFRILQKYDRFFQMMGTYPGKAIVPTLDIDLAWHTDQLSPAAYYKHCMNTTKVFMDHDDKVEEKKLSDAFEWTCEAYQHMFGERYSQCNCWYCEAVAELASLPVPDATTLEKGPHISAHNSVRVVGVNSEVNAQLEAARKGKEFQLQESFQQARVHGRVPGHAALDAHHTHAPYLMDPNVTRAFYASNPQCMTTGTGAVESSVGGSEAWAGSSSGASPGQCLS